MKMLITNYLFCMMLQCTYIKKRKYNTYIWLAYKQIISQIVLTHCRKRMLLNIDLHVHLQTHTFFFFSCGRI